MSVLTVPRSIASSFLKNFSINFTATVPPPYWQGPWKRISTSKRQLVCLNLEQFSPWGMSFDSNKGLLTAGFQCAYDNCALRFENVRVQRSQDDGAQMDRDEIR